MSRLPRALLGAAAATAGLAALRARPPGGAARWQRTNHRGAPVSLASGPALALGAGLGAGTVPAAVAAAGAGALGAYDDVVGDRAEQRSSKGLRGHAAALAEGQVTSGVVKVAGIGATGLLAAGLSGRSGADLLLDGALVAGTANLLNLLDLRPGRALKAGLLAALALDEPGVAGAAAALLPGDLREQTMLGDAGANALGAVLGTALAARCATRPARAAALAGVVGLTAASEVVSFSRVIDAVPPLRWADRLGRRA
ncbi:MAG TPA: hypothetical protein VNU66_12540 [Mycobacteriales bacterium]|nr:hypothetical protein [Mycobacteriales bacterium]